MKTEAHCCVSSCALIAQQSEDAPDGRAHPSPTKRRLSVSALTATGPRPHRLLNLRHQNLHRGRHRMHAGRCAATHPAEPTRTVSTTTTSTQRRSRSPAERDTQRDDTDSADNRKLNHAQAVVGAGLRATTGDTRCGRLPRVVHRAAARPPGAVLSRKDAELLVRVRSHNHLFGTYDAGPFSLPMTPVASTGRHLPRSSMVDLARGFLAATPPSRSIEA